MKAKIVAYYGYNYISKDTGEVKTGRSIDVVMLFDFKEDDGRGNFAYGQNTRTGIRVPDKYTHTDMQAMIGKEVELIFGQAPGRRYESLVSIDLV